MYGLRLKDGTKVSGLHYKPDVSDVIRIDKTGKWYRVIKVVGRVVYATEWLDPRGGGFY